MAEANKSDMDIHESEKPSTKMLMTRETKTSVEVTQPEMDHGKDVDQLLSNIGQVGTVNQTNTINYISHSSVHLHQTPHAFPAGPTNNQGHEEKTKQSDLQKLEKEMDKKIVQQKKEMDDKIDQHKEQMDDKMDQHKEEMDDKIDQHKEEIDDKIDQHKEVMHDKIDCKLKMVTDEMRNNRGEQRLDTDYLGNLLKTLLQVAEGTKTKVESLSSRNDPAEAMSTLRAEVEETRTTIQGELAKIESSQNQMNSTVETKSEEAERQRTELQINQKQIWSTIVSTEQQMQSHLEEVKRVYSQESGGRVVELKPEFSDNLEILKSRMRRENKVVNYLYQASAISDEEKEKLNSITNSRDKVQHLVEFLNLKDDGFSNLICALEQDGQDALAEECKVR